MSLRTRILPLLILILVVAGGVVAQTLPEGPRVRPQPRVHDGMTGYYERQLVQIDQLIRLGHNSRANALLEQMSGGAVSEDQIRRRRIRIALAVDDHGQAATLCRASLVLSPQDAGLWRELATALVVIGPPEDARDALNRYLSLVDEPKGGFATAVDILRGAGSWLAAVALVDSARTILNDPVFLARPRALGLLRLDRAAEAAREVQADLQSNPFNLQLLRRDLVADDVPPLPAAFAVELTGLATQPGAGVEVGLLAANVALMDGRSDAALALVQPRLDEAVAARAALNNAGTLVREFPILIDEREQAAVSEYLLTILPVIARQPGLPVRLHHRALDHLAETCVHALEHDLLDRDPAAAVQRFGELLRMVRVGHPESEHLYLAQIELARFSRDRLHDAPAAAVRLERLLLDLDLPLEGVALARLALGECYLAARDTSRGRQVLTALGRDTDFRAAAGHAHFLLARLDLAQGHFGTARDRFAAVALDDPAAPYANDALELGLVVAEELQNPTGGPDLLARYARAVWWDLAAAPDSQRVALQRYIARAAVQADLAEKQPLLERARFELAGLQRDAGLLDEALAQLERIVLDQPDGRLAARAMDVRGAILAADRHDAAAARREYERLLVQYPDYLFVSEVRQRLRDLP